MLKKILSVVIAAAMLISVLLISACKEEKIEESNDPVIVLTAKEKLFKTTDAADAFFSELKNSMGIITASAAAPESKTTVYSMGLELKELSVMGSPYIEEPIGVSMIMYQDALNKTQKGLMEVMLGNTVVPVEMIMSEGGIFFGIDKVTDKMLKIPLEGLESATGGMDITYEDVQLLFAEYFDFFTDSLPEELFTEQTGTVTVDGKEIADAETVTFTATSKQLAQALLEVVKKARADAKLKSMAANFALGESEKADMIKELEKALDDARKALAGEIEVMTDDHFITLVTITEKGVLRSIELTSFNGEEQLFAAAFTTLSKDNTLYVKGEVTEDGSTLLTVDYEQETNDKGSADGKLEMVAFDEEMINTFVISFKGTKEDTLLTIDADIEVSTEYTEYDWNSTQSIGLLIKYQYISDEEVNFSAEITVDDGMYMKMVFEVTGGYKLQDYEEIKAPEEGNVIVVNMDEDPTFMDELLEKILEEYPGIQDFIDSFGGFHGEPGDMLFGLTSEDDENEIYLYDDGSGSLYASLYNVSYDRGTYSAELFDGTVISGTYSINGDMVTIDQTEYDYEEYEGLPDLYNYNYMYRTNIYLVDEGLWVISTDFTYLIEEDMIYVQFAIGGELELEFIDYGDYVTINGVKYFKDLLVYIDNGDLLQ